MVSASERKFKVWTEFRMMLVKTKSLIEEKLSGRYRNFLKYCQESGKNFIEELAIEDFIAYRSEYAVSHEDIKQLKNLLDFQEKISTEEISPTQDVFNDSEEILQKYFNISDLTPYENVLVIDLYFNARVQHCLRINGYRTLAELLKSSRQKLSSLRNFGQGSFDNLISTLKKFFDSRRKKIPAKTLRLANEELDGFLRDAALNHDPQIDLIISAFEKFSDFVTIKGAFRDLPEEFRDKRVRPFLIACGLEKNNLFVVLPENLTLEQFPKFLSENNFDFDVDELKKFVDELDFDVRVAAKKMLTNLFENERDFEIVRRRAEGATLEQAGKEFGLTRERIRQIESKPARKFRHPKNRAKKILYFIRVLTNEKSLFTLDDAKNFLDTSDAEMIWFFVIKALKDEENLGIKRFNYDKENGTEIFNYDKESNAFVFHHGTTFDEETLIKNLPDIMEEKFFEESIINLAHEKNYPVELLKLKLSKIYKRSGKFFHRERLTPTFKCKYILKERFPNGYKISDETYYSRFIRYLQEIFDEKTPTNQRALGALISTIGVLCDRGKYIHPDFVHIPPEIMERVKNFIDNSERTAIYYKEIFESLKNIFADTQITNHYFLQGVIKFYKNSYKLSYTLCKDYLTKVSGVDMTSEFYSFIAKHPEFSVQNIKEYFVSLTDASINFFLQRHPLVIRIGDGTFVNTLCLDLREEDFAQIENFLRRNCSNPISSRVLLDLFFEHFPDFMCRNEIQNHKKLFGVLQYMFRDEFNFSRPYISTANIKDINNKKFLLRLLENMEEISIEDLISICEENGIHYVARTYLIDSLRPDFIRVDEFTLMRPESIGVTDEIISAVVESIQSAVERNGGWQAAQTFEDYEWLPQLEISWNSFLLESIATLAEDALCKIKISSTSTNFSPAIFVAAEFAEDDYQSFLKKVLIAEHSKEPFRTEKEIFDWLKAQGLCNKKLPKFLEGGRAFELFGE